MHVKNLTDSSFEDIVTCFLKAFANYYVEFPSDKEYFRQRWELSGIRYDLSYGMFHNSRLVGFILHGVEKRDGHFTAFNLATGVIPEYRGRKVTQAIYHFALLDLKRNGVTKSRLEVIKANEYAIRAYNSIGFQITRHYKCFSGTIRLQKPMRFELIETAIADFDFGLIPDQRDYSWENRRESIQGGDFICYQVLNGSTVEAVFIINKLGYIPQFEVFVEDDEAWSRLFAAISSISEKIKINNVDERFKSKIKQLQNFGLNNTIDQYEMELLIE